MQELKHSATYFFAAEVDSTLRTVGSSLPFLHEWHVDQSAEMFSASFEKRSILHSFARFIIFSTVWDRMETAKEARITILNGGRIWVDQLADDYGELNTSFQEYLSECERPSGVVLPDDVHDYITEWLYGSEQLEVTYEALAAEIFHVLFSDRQVLARLNNYASCVVRGIKVEGINEEFRPRFESNGVLKRVYVPRWVKRAVFYRDHGRCASCTKNLTGLLSSDTDAHYDHIIPLAEGGLNDVTNIQLLCSSCNWSKGDSPRMPSCRYVPWYE